MELEQIINEKIKRFEDLKNQLIELNKQIGALSEQQRALYNAGLEMKGAIDGLMDLKIQAAKALESSKTAALTLPVGVKPVVADAPVEAPVTLEVK